MKRVALAIMLLAFPVQAEEWRVIHGGAGESGLTSNNLAINATSRVLTGSFGSNVNVVRLLCVHATATAACYVAIAPTGSPALTATTVTGFRLEADESMVIRASGGETVAAITSAGTGNLIVHEMTR